MKTASYRLLRVVDGLCSFADVTVCDTPGSAREHLADTPADWLAAANQGIQAALTALGVTPPPISLAKLVYTHVDTTADAVHAAAFMATARLLDREHQFQLSRSEGKWCVIMAPPA